MNRDQFNRSEMCNTVHAYLQSHIAIWSGTPAIVAAVSDLAAKIVSIGQKISKQQTPTSGATQSKAQARTALEDKTLELADQLAALAAATSNMTLAASAELTLSQLDQLADDALEQTCQRILGLVNTHIAALADYGVTAADATDLGDLVADFHDVKASPRAALADRAAETSTLPDLLRDTNTLLRTRLDKLMTRFKKSNPTFYSGYRTARVIVDKGNPPAPAKQPGPAPTP